MPIKKINLLIIRQLFLIFLLFNLNNYNLLGVPPATEAFIIKQKAENAIKLKDITKFNAAMSEFIKMARVPIGAAAVETKRRDVVRKALISVQSPADAPFFIEIRDQIVGFASETEIRNAMIRAELAPVPAHPAQIPPQQMAEILQLPEPQQERAIRELPVPQQFAIIQQLPAPQQAKVIEKLPAQKQAVIIQQLPEPQQAIIIEKLPAPQQVAIIEQLPEPKKIVIIRELQVSRQFQIIEDLPKAQHARLIEQLPAPVPSPLPPPPLPPELSLQTALTARRQYLANIEKNVESMQEDIENIEENIEAYGKQNPPQNQELKAQFLQQIRNHGNRSKERGEVIKKMEQQIKQQQKIVKEDPKSKNPIGQALLQAYEKFVKELPEKYEKEKKLQEAVDKLEDEWEEV